MGRVVVWVDVECRQTLSMLFYHVVYACPLRVRNDLWRTLAIGACELLQLPLVSQLNATPIVAQTV